MMKIVNRTHWRTEDLKSILQRCAEHEQIDSEKRRKMIVTVVYSRRHDSSSGCAVLGGSRSTVRIPKGAQQPDKRMIEHYTQHDAQHDTTHLAEYLAHFNEAQQLLNIKLSFASVVCHEFAHLRGMTHRQMPNHYRWSKNWEKYVAFVNELPLTVKPARTKKVVDVQEVRYERTVAAIKRWATKAKRAATELKKLKQRQRYYERAFAQRTAQKQVRE